MKKLLAILCVIIMLAGLTPAGFAAPVSADEVLLEYDKSALDKLTTDGSITISDELGNYGTDVSLKYDTSNFSKQKEATHNFIEALLELMNQGQSECVHTVIEEDDYEKIFRIEISFDNNDYTENLYQFNIINNHISVRHYENGAKHAVRSCDVNNIDEIIEFIINADNNDLSVFGKADTTTKTDDISSEEKPMEEEPVSKAVYYDKSILDTITADGEAEIRFLSKERDINHGFGFSSGKLKKQKIAVKDFIDTLIELIEEDGKECSQKPHKTEGLQTYAYVSICLTDSARYNVFEIEIYDNYVIFYSCGDNVRNSITTYFETDNIEEIADFLSTTYRSELSSLDRAGNNEWNNDEKGYIIDYDNETMSLSSRKENFDIKERLEFDVKLNSSYEGTALSEVGKTGETIHGKIELLFTGTQYYILTLSGSRGTKQFYHIETSWGFSGLTGHRLTFNTTYTVEDNQMMILDNSETKWDFIYVNGDVSSDDKLEISIDYDYYSNQGIKRILEPSNIDATKVKYSYYGDEKYLDSGRNMFTLFRLPNKEEYLSQIQQEMQEEAGKEPQNPERVITNYKGKDGDVMLDYYINFIAQIPLDFSSGFTPAWYDKLGSDVTATLIGFTQTVDGKDRRHFTMMKLSGSKDSLWFARADVALCEALIYEDDYISDKDLYVDMDYRSLISFDGTTEIRNLIEYDTFGTTLHFSNDGSLTLTGLSFKTNGNAIHIDANNINYIGGGKATYENLW